MVLPTTWLSAIVLLVLAFVCLGSWPNTFKWTGARWRFELYSFDFAIGALLLAVVAAFTLGTVGSELNFSDSLLVAGRRSQALAICAGAAFTLGNMLLLSGMSLLGASAAFPLSFGIAAIVTAVLSIAGANYWYVLAGILVLLVNVILAAAPLMMKGGFSGPPVAAPPVAPKATVAAAPSPSTRGASGRPRKSSTYVRPSDRKRMSGSAKGVIVSVISGLSLGSVFTLMKAAESSVLHMGAYGGVLLACVGMVISTIVLNFYFMNIAIEGGNISFNAYFAGQLRQHLLGFLGGAVWCAGALAFYLAANTPETMGVQPWLKLVTPFATAALAAAWGLGMWKEYRSAPSTIRFSLIGSVILLLCGLVLVGIGISHAPATS